MYFSTMYDYQSSSSSSTSGVTTPVDGPHPVFVAFPKPQASSPRDHSLSSSGSSTLSFNKHRVLPKSPHFFVTRPPKLSLDSSKAKPLPAAPSTPDDHSPLGAFSQTPSAEGHLRSIVSRATYVPPSLVSTKEGLLIPFPASLAGRLRTSSLRSLALPTRVKHVASVFYRDADDVEDDDSEEDRESDDDAAEAFWPRRYVPTTSRPPAPITTNTNTTTTSTSLRASPPNTRTRTFSSPSAPQRPSARIGEAVPKRPGPHVRAFTEPALSVFPRNNLQHHTINSTTGLITNRRPSLASAGVRPSRSFLEPPKSKKRAGELPGASANDGTASTSTLNPALAAVEHASRLRARCVCGVCGKAGVDYPRCPRCTATWCSRQCRISSAAAGGARHTCISAGAGPAGAVLSSRQVTIGA
ncbi:hypothetical protein M0805_000137 [Coniferiporia weirii]|nr:hypothetical protein M0805_000137 [Coniferiporia weirii]